MSKYLLFQMPDGEIKIETDHGAICKKRIESCLAEGAKIAGTVESELNILALRCGLCQSAREQYEKEREKLMKIFDFVRDTL